MFRNYFIVFFVFLFNHVLSQHVDIPWPEVKDSSNLVDTHSKAVQYQAKGIFKFDEIGVGIRNDFPGARLNDVSLINDSTLQVLIRPENFPINISPWYAFKIWSENPDIFYIRFNYEQGMHRYSPKLSSDGLVWEQIHSENVLISNNDSSAFFRVHVTPDTLWFSAQELMCTDYIRQWENELLQKPFVNDHLIGHSTNGRQLKALTMAAGHDKNLLIILSRQHPPELTGFMEMMRFVETLAGDKRIAKRFRKKFEVIIMPLMNPDGVENGHWRHNAGGVDLNRDWRYFNQPETFALRKFVLQEIKKRHLEIRYAIDFHSTQTDIFYTPDPSTLASGTGITNSWVQAINKKYPNNQFSPEPSGVEGQFSKNWFLHELKTEAITYEVGDSTDRDVIQKRGETSAIKLMRILLKKYR